MREWPIPYHRCLKCFTVRAVIFWIFKLNCRGLQDSIIVFIRLFSRVTNIQAVNLS